eukprot:10631196-Heterocapsa_arctica.AAC.1
MLPELRKIPEALAVPRCMSEAGERFSRSSMLTSPPMSPGLSSRAPGVGPETSDWTDPAREPRTGGAEE